jgi:phospholipid/cholesterol/gamma-HCH transport system ATP-binding protein
MNSVMGIGEYIMFLHKGRMEWDGDNNSILHSDNQALKEFVFASKIMEKLL